MKNKWLLSSMLLAGALMLNTSVMAKGDCDKRGSHGKKHEMPKLDEKVMKKAHFLLKNSKELGLTEEQLKTVKNLKFDIKKLKIQKEAETKVIHLDVLRELHNDTVDAAKVNQLIDQKFEVKKAFAKELVAKFVELKSVLTPEQKVKAKEIWSSKKD